MSFLGIGLGVGVVVFGSVDDESDYGRMIVVYSHILPMCPVADRFYESMSAIVNGLEKLFTRRGTVLLAAKFDMYDIQDPWKKTTAKRVEMGIV